MTTTPEDARMEEVRLGKTPWRHWGPYLSERQWGTVREDYSANGDAWEYFPHDHARSRAYRWGEDGIAGISDDSQQLCFALALWNGKDPILKERLFGLTGKEGNHGEDVKEYYFYLDNLPSHAYMKYLYKYPQGAYPYEDLVETNRKRNRKEFEYELLDTGIFNENRYFDIFVEYAKSSADEIFIRITAANRGQESAKLYLLPTLWFRNTWSWSEDSAKPSLTAESKQVIKASHPSLGNYRLYCQGADALLFTENETNNQRLFNSANDTPFVKDAFHEFLIHSKKDAVNPKSIGTKAAAQYALNVEGGKTAVIKLCLTKREGPDLFGKSFDELFTTRKNEADAFYKRVTPYPLSEDMRNVQRQAFAGLLWNKQHYHYPVVKWLYGDPAEPKPSERRMEGRNHHWQNLDASDIFSMPDKWEYPWFAAWDLAFHTISLAMIDPEFAKKQLILLTREWYMAPDGQIPAYEWSFGDVNPPVHAWAALRIYEIENTAYGRKDRVFLERMFQKLVINFTWWVNRKDSTGKNIFEGGFLGLDNIGAFDRSLGPPLHGTYEQPDGTGWMGMYCLNLLEIALELSKENSTYEDMATKFFEHFIAIADAINNIAFVKEGLWDSEEGFYYGLLIQPDGNLMRLKQDNLTGVVPLFAVSTNSRKEDGQYPFYRKRFDWFVKNKPHMVEHIANIHKLNTEKQILLAFAGEVKLTKILKKVLDEEQFFSPHGIRSVSKKLAANPFTVTLGGQTFRLDYEPAEGTTPIFGGNSNWRGPIWFPLNYLLIESLQKFHYYYRDDLKVECPAGSGNMSNLWDVSTEITRRLIGIFLKDKDGKRPVYGGMEKFQNDPHWKDYLLFHEYFHGDNGAGLGASNQTGWTGLVAKLIHQYAEYSQKRNI